MNNKSVRLIFTALVLSIASGAARSQDSQSHDVYLQGNLATVSLNTPSNGGTTNVDLGGQGESVAAKALIGMPIGPLFGVEAGFIVGGQTQIATPSGLVDTTTRVYLFNAILTAPLTDHLAMAGRLGVASTKASVDIPARSYSSDSVQHPLYAGVELSWKLDPQWSLVADFDRLGQTAVFRNGGGQQSNAGSIGIRFRF